MKGIPKQSEGAPARPVQTPWGPRPDVSGSIRLQLFSKCSFNPMSVIGYDVG